jgi:hypothetical protein
MGLVGALRRDPPGSLRSTGCGTGRRGGELLGATGVNVGGVVYDVEIVEGTCIDLYDGCDDLSDFTFTTLADALLAARALQDQVVLDGVAGNFDTVPSLTAGCSGALCGTAFPYGLPNATQVSVVSAVSQAVEATDFFGAGTTERTFDSSTGTFHTLTTYAVWTPATSSVQVPSSTPIARGLLVALILGWSVRLVRKRP